MKVNIFAPSYKRPARSITQELYPMVKLVVRESEADEYRSNGNEIIVCPDKAQGNVSRIRNWILNNLMEDADALAIIDDDSKGMFRWFDAERVPMNEKMLIEFMEKQTDLCQQFGFYHWGVNCVKDKRSYKESQPFSTLSYIGSPFSVHLKESQIRYDENLPLKEDYDMTLQHLYRHGGALRINYAYYDVKQAQQEGGCASMRNLSKEKQQLFALQNKWGRDIVRRDKGSKRSFDFNPIIRVPLRGI